MQCETQNKDENR